MTPYEKAELIRLLKLLLKQLETPRPDPDLQTARFIAAEESRQTGTSYNHFIRGDYDRAYGVRTALRALKAGRSMR